MHGLSDEFLADKPVFAAIADEFVEFIGDGRLVIHNAAFDIGFLNAEFARTGHRPRADRVVDTLALARGASIRARPTTSMPCARATGSTTRAAPSTARSSTPRSWPRSISS